MNILNFISRRKPQNLQVARLRNNDEIPASRINAAQKLGAKVADAVRSREAIIESNPSIDRDFAMPGANWGDPTTNDHLKSFQLLETLEWDEMRALRIRSQNFTGNNLIIMAPELALAAPILSLKASKKIGVIRRGTKQLTTGRL